MTLPRPSPDKDELGDVLEGDPAEVLPHQQLKPVQTAGEGADPQQPEVPSMRIGQGLHRKPLRR